MKKSASPSRGGRRAADVMNWLEVLSPLPGLRTLFWPLTDVVGY